MQQLSLFPSDAETPTPLSDPSQFKEHLCRFSEFGNPTVVFDTRVSLDDNAAAEVPTYVNEFWTSKQRAASSLHEVSYRACFKPHLPRFFIERLTGKGQTVYDPFMGRGTTVMEAALMERKTVGCDINPLSKVFVAPRLSPPTLEMALARMKKIDLKKNDEFPDELLVFYHPDTLQGICALKKYFTSRSKDGLFDNVDAWLQMVALNRLTGHSPGFFSVYTMPPNQAVSVESQRKINKERNQVPPERDIVQIIARKTKSLLSTCDYVTRQALKSVSRSSLLLTADSEHTPRIKSRSVHLAVTSPPFLDVVDYASDNWLRCWFLGIDARTVPISILKKLEDWYAKMVIVLRELRRVLVSGGFVAFEVGEVRSGKIKLEETVIRAASQAGLEPILVLINSQKFTKTANCWGVDNNSKGTNTNRIVLLRSTGE